MTTPRRRSTNANLGPILTTAIYPLPLFMELTGLSNAAMRQARRKGLKVYTVGRRSYVRGQDWSDFHVAIRP
jgi:hypothetical protein